LNKRYFSIILTIFLILVLIGPGTVSAYYLTLDAPAEVRVSQPITVTGSTNVPPPDKIDIVLSLSSNIPIEKERQSIAITDKGDTSFNVTFQTPGYEKGNYKVEALSQTVRDFSAGSRNLRVVKLTDRSDIVRFSSPLYQDFEGKLAIETRIQGYDDNAIQMEVKKGNTSVFGPESVPVSRGLLKYELPIKEPGKYEITLNDSRGFIGTYPVQVGEESKSSTTTPEPAGTEVPAVHETETSVSQKNSEHLTVTTPEPTKSASSVTPSETKVTQNKTEDKPVSVEGISSTASVSRDAPAYFLVSVKQAPVTVSTSSDEDWVLEYKTTPGSAAIKVNEKGKGSPEQVTVKDSIQEIYLKVYPYSYKSTGDVTITASNVASIELSDKAAQAFGAPPRYGNSGSSGEQKSPAPLAGVVLGIISAALLLRRK